MSPRYNLTWKKHVTSISCKLEFAIWSRDTGLRIPCYDRCQLTIPRMSNINDRPYKPRLHVSVNLLARVRPPSCASRSWSSCVRATSNTASHDNHEKIKSWVSFSLPYEYWAPLGFAIKSVGTPRSLRWTGGSGDENTHFRIFAHNHFCIPLFVIGNSSKLSRNI